MAKYDKNNAEKWLNEHHFGYYNNEHDKGTGAEEIPTINRIFEAWDDEPEWLTADPVDQDREHANLYGGDREYCDECGRRLTMGEWGGYCSHCHPDYEDYEDEYLDDDDTDSEWELVDRKNVEDSDGFITEYSWYRKGDEHVMVFGDSDLYLPEDGDYDAEFDSEERAREWFSSYEGFTDHNEGIDKDRFNCLEDECAEEKPLNEAKTYRGIPNTIYVYHGDWSDPEVYINGKGFSEWDVEDYIWGDYVEACEDNGEEPTDEGFAKYCEENGEDLCNSFYYSNLEFMSAKEIVNEVQEYADDSLGMIYMVTDDYVEVIFNYPGHTNGADDFIHDLEDSYLGKENLIKIEKTDNSTGDELDPDDYEPEVIVKVTATPNPLSEDIVMENIVMEEFEDAPYTKSEIRDELRRETQKWTKKSDEIFYGFESEYDYALTVLKKHYKDVEGEEKGDRYVIKFSNPNKGLKEGWAHFEFTSGSNPYIAKTEEEKKRLCKKWGKDCEFKGNINGNDYYVINDKVENEFASWEDLDESYGMAKDIINATNVMDVDSWKLALEREYPAPTEDVKKQRQANFGKAVGAFDTIKIPGQWYLYTSYCDFDVNYVHISDNKGSNNIGKTPKEVSDRMQHYWIKEDKYELVLDTCDDNLSVDDIGVRIFKGKLPKDADGKRQCWEYQVYIVRFENRERYDTHYFTDSLHREVELSESILTNDGYVTPSKGAVEQFLDKYGFGDDRYPKTVYTDNASKGKEIVASFTDGISASDFKVIEKHAGEFFGKCPVEVTLGKEHKDGGDLWATIIFDFGKCMIDEDVERDTIKISSDKKVEVETPDTSEVGDDGHPIQVGLKGKTAKLESKQLNEGPGAGYTLEGVIRVTGIETLKPVKYDADIYYGPNNSYDVTFECVGVGTIEDFRFNSYYYGDIIDSANIDISTVKVNLWKEGGFEDIEAYVKSNLEDIRDCIVGARVESSYTYGGGYVHSKFDGTVCDIDEPLNNSYSAEYNDVCAELFAMDATIRDTDIIEYVDKAVTGDTYYVRYEVMDRDGEYIEDFEDESDAIEYAKSYPASEVVETTYHKLFNGDIDIEESKTSWENPFDDIEEAIYDKAEQIYKSSEINSDILERVAKRFFHLSDEQLQELVSRWEAEESDDFDESFKSIPGGKAIMESLVKTTLESYPNASSKVIARKTFDKSFEKHNITFEKWHKLVESVNK